jgi:hypothetical protein
MANLVRRRRAITIFALAHDFDALPEPPAAVFAPYPSFA